MISKINITCVTICLIAGAVNGMNGMKANMLAELTQRMAKKAGPAKAPAKAPAGMTDRLHAAQEEEKTNEPSRKRPARKNRPKAAFNSVKVREYFENCTSYKKDKSSIWTAMNLEERNVPNITPEIVFKAYYCGEKGCEVCDTPSVHLERALKIVRNQTEEIMEVQHMVTAVEEMLKIMDTEVCKQQIADGECRARNIVDAYPYFCKELSTKHDLDLGGYYEAYVKYLETFDETPGSLMLAYTPAIDADTKQQQLAVRSVFGYHYVLCDQQHNLYYGIWYDGGDASKGEEYKLLDTYVRLPNYLASQIKYLGNYTTGTGKKYANFSYLDMEFHVNYRAAVGWVE